MLQYYLSQYEKYFIYNKVISNKALVFRIVLLENKENGKSAQNLFLSFFASEKFSLVILSGLAMLVTSIVFRYLKSL